MSNSVSYFNPFKKEDDSEHFPCVIEWWGVEAFFQDTNKIKRWSYKGSLTQWIKKNNTPGSNFISTLFDINEGKHSSYYSRRDFEKLKFDNSKFEARYDDCFIKTRYPDYEMKFIDPKNDVRLFMKYEPISLPHWVAQNLTNGWLPMNLGLSRYGFVPRSKLKGKIRIKGEEFDINGEGYFEHLWGNFSYTNPFKYISEVKKSISVYSKLMMRWFKSRETKIPKSIVFSSENNPVGYDWAWAVFDNGSSLFLGNSLFWVSKGPFFGLLIFTKDGKDYTEFYNVQFKYLKTRYIKEYDFYYPSEFSINASEDNKHLRLRFKMTVESREFLMKLSGKKKAFFICEAPGIIEGYYYDGKEHLKLKGHCKIEPQRQTSRLGHNSIGFDLSLPPKGFGLKSTLDSHYLDRKISAKIQVLPKPVISFNIKKLKR